MVLHICLKLRREQPQNVERSYTNPGFPLPRTETPRGRGGGGVEKQLGARSPRCPRPSQTPGSGCRLSGPSRAGLGPYIAVPRGGKSGLSSSAGRGPTCLSMTGGAAESRRRGRRTRRRGGATLTHRARQKRRRRRGGGWNTTREASWRNSPVSAPLVPVLPRLSAAPRANAPPCCSRPSPSTRARCALKASSQRPPAVHPSSEPGSPRTTSRSRSAARRAEEPGRAPPNTPQRRPRPTPPF